MSTEDRDSDSGPAEICKVFGSHKRIMKDIIFPKQQAKQQLL